LHRFARSCISDANSAAQGATGSSPVISTPSSNFYYRVELDEMFADGFLTRLDLAFSRDQRERVYVQHRMIEHGAEIWRWLQDGAHLYVCGDASRMASVVDDALLQIVGTHGNLGADDASAMKKQLVTEKRYHLRDVY
jgi:sulfite reductase (NADPH) flavoprotein alpha-component